MDSLYIEEKMVEDKSSPHVHFAGRVPAGTVLPVCLSKNGVNHVSYRIDTVCISANFVYSRHIIPNTHNIIFHPDNRKASNKKRNSIYRPGMLRMLFRSTSSTTPPTRIRVRTASHDGSNGWKTGPSTIHSYLWRSTCSFEYLHRYFGASFAVEGEGIGLVSFPSAGGSISRLGRN